MTIRQISVFVENHAGCLAEVAELLADKGVDIRALSIADTTDYGILRLIVDDPRKAALALSDSNYLVSVTEVLAVHIDDSPGGLSKVIRLLSDNGVDIAYLYAFVTRTVNNAYVIIRVENNERAIEILKNNDIKIASPDEIYSI